MAAPRIDQPKVEMWDIDRLIPYDKNAKIHTEVQIESLANVIKTQGWDVPIVVDKDGVIIKGHGRRLAAIHLGLKKVPVICRRDLTPAQVRAARLSDNRVALTEFDTVLIKEELQALNAEGFEMGSLGFDQRELDMMIRDLDRLDPTAFETPAEPAANEDPKDAQEAAESAPAPATRGVDLGKLLGFKTVPESAERALAKFMSYAEAMTKKSGAEAFVAFCDQVVNEIEARV